MERLNNPGANPTFRSRGGGRFLLKTSATRLTLFFRFQVPLAVSCLTKTWFSYITIMITKTVLDQLTTVYKQNSSFLAPLFANLSITLSILISMSRCTLRRAKPLSLVCPICSLSQVFSLRKVEKLRLADATLTGRDIKISKSELTSGYRCLSHSLAVSSTELGKYLLLS